MSTVENVSSTVDCQNSVQPETCDKTKDDMEQCHSIEKSTDNIENEERETDVGSSTADAKPSDNSAERAEVVEEECHQKVIHELTKDSELIQKEETQTIDVDDVSHCSHGSICEPDKQKDDIFDKDTKDIENFENKEDAVAQEDKYISKCDESVVAKYTSLAEDKSEKENAPETVENSSKDEAEAATEVDKHSSVEDLASKETYEAVYSDILQPQEDISGAYKDVSEADDEKDTSEAEKEESVAKDTSITDDKSEKENALETVFKAPPAFETDKFHQIPEDKSSIDYPKYGEELSSVQDDKLPIGLEENKQYEVKTMEEVTESQNDEEVASTAPETVEDSSKDEADAATEQDEHCSSENLSNKETYEAVYSNILQPQEDISVAEKDVSEADNEKDSSEAEKEESVNKDNSLDDDKSEKETTPEIIVDSFEKEKDSSMAENDKLFKEAGNDKDTSEAEKDKSEDKNISETDKQMSEEKNTSEAEKENSDDKDASLVDEKSEKETAPEIAADSFETDKFHPIPADKSPIEFPKYGTEFGSKESSMAENNKLSKEADNEADTEKDISEADERETSEAEKDKSVSKDTSLADEKSEKETVPEITDDSLTKEKDSSIGENAKEAEKEELASEDKSEKDIAPETVDESSKDKAEASTELDKHSSAEDLVDKSKYTKEMNVNEPHL